MIKINSKFNKGFTLVETLVALSIFVVSVLVMIVVSSRGIVDTRNATNKATATFLADEGIELVRNIRDTYVMGGSNSTASDWQTFYNDVISKCGLGNGNKGCKIGPRFDLTNLTTNNNDYSCNNACEYMVRTGYGYYGYFDSGTNYTQTPYQRVIYVEPINPDIIKVTSKVNWEHGTSQSSVEVSEYLYNWYQ